MAEGTKSKTKTAKIGEIREVAEALFQNEAERNLYIRETFEELQKIERQERAEKQKLTFDFEREKLVLEKDERMERERLNHELLMRDRDIELARLDRSNQSSPISAEFSVNSSPNFTIDYFDDKSETIETFLDRFERTARHTGLPADRFCFRLAQALRGKAYEVYAKLPPASQENYEAVKAALLTQFELTAASYHNKFRNSRLEKRETFSNLSQRLDKYLDRWLKLSPFTDTLEGLRELVLVEQLRECMSPQLRVFIDESGVSSLVDIVAHADRYLTAHKDDKQKNKTDTTQTNGLLSKTPPSPQEGQTRHNDIKKAHYANSRTNRKKTNGKTHPSPPRAQGRWCSFHKTSTHDTRDCRQNPHPQGH